MTIPEATAYLAEHKPALAELRVSMQAIGPTRDSYVPMLEAHLLVLMEAVTLLCPTLTFEEYTK